ncbi:DUF305 domain-containing protein [Ramlibacter sp.]|uniref:DUF305 domain-containing protein n=1 Tax=Ramlibacter sp. TaxID=1917967 RepID=UPI002C15F826|nr:DUF305 domain-containing protein [Ramlibacter sp.]HWI83136.1 DUF305 domain-containing protein [Ramlibacter sp.]
MNTQTMPRQERRHHERRAASQQTTPSQEHSAGHSMKMASYGRFAAMVATSTVIGFAAMYLNVFEIDHVDFSWTRLFMALVMGGVMTAVMMLFMWNMYPEQKSNWAVMGVAAVIFATGVILARTQATVGDVSYMKAMIPHHSIAILTSSRARIEDPRVRKLADGIIETQKKEIAEMKQLISELEKR